MHHDIVGVKKNQDKIDQICSTHRKPRNVLKIEAGKYHKENPFVVKWLDYLMSLIYQNKGSLV